MPAGHLGMGDEDAHGVLSVTQYPAFDLPCGARNKHQLTETARNIVIFDDAH